jgi:hypothetical protein
VEVGALEIIDNILGCESPMLLIEAYCRNSTKAKSQDISLGLRDVSRSPREIS